MVILAREQCKMPRAVPFFFLQDRAIRGCCGKPLEWPGNAGRGVRPDLNSHHPNVLLNVLPGPNDTGTSFPKSAARLMAHRCQMNHMHGFEQLRSSASWLVAVEATMCQRYQRTHANSPPAAPSHLHMHGNLRTSSIFPSDPNRHAKARTARLLHLSP